MRIVIDARESGSSTGRYVDKLVEHMHKLKPNYEMVILTKTPRLEYFKQVAPNFEVLESNFKEFSFPEQLGYLKQLKRLKADLVHFSMTQQPVRYRGRKLTTVHDLTTMRFANPTKNQMIFKFKQLVYGWVIKKVAKTSIALITPSQYVKKDVAGFANITPRKIAVTYEAADKITARAEPIIRLNGKPFIMYIGRATPHKNLRRLVEAFEILTHKYPDLMLVLAGRMDANYKRLEAFASGKRMSHSVVFTDFVSEGELRWLYENTSAYVFPSLSEGFGLPGLEAMIQGAPVVSSKATCLPEVYGDGAIYFDPLVAQDIAQKISHVLSDAKLRDDLIKKGRAQVNKYAWETTAKQTLSIYKQILDKLNT